MIDQFKLDLAEKLESIFPIKVKTYLGGKEFSSHEHPPKILLYIQAEEIITKSIDFLIKFYQEHKRCIVAPHDEA